MKILETSLNLRVDRKKFRDRTNLDYKLSKNIALNQLYYKDDVDLFCNVEYMECLDEEYLYEFHQRGYKRITATFGNDNRGILCYIKSEYTTQVIHQYNSPHFIHFRAYKEKDYFDIIVCRILCLDGGPKDFKNRMKQWSFITNYLDTLEDKSRLIITGDWNHGCIRNNYIQGKHNQYEYNYQRICKDLEERKLTMGINLQANHKEHSYMGFLAIDHIAIGECLSFNETEKPEYSEYMINAPIGTPDHAYLYAEIIEKE